jgi:hypothetical protein
MYAIGGTIPPQADGESGHAFQFERLGQCVDGVCIYAIVTADDNPGRDAHETTRTTAEDAS